MTTLPTSTIPGYIAGTWNLDPTHSEVGFSVRHLMVSKVRGRFGKFDGEFVTAEDPLASSVAATIDLGSVITGDENRDAHLRSSDFFDVGANPVMAYRSTGLRPTEVITAICLIAHGAEHHAIDETDVSFRECSDAMLRDYIATRTDQATPRTAASWGHGRGDTG